MSIQDHLKDARRDACKDMVELLFIAAAGQRALESVAGADISAAREKLGVMLAAFRAYEASRQMTAGLASVQQPLSGAERGLEGGGGEVLQGRPNG